MRSRNRLRATASFIPIALVLLLSVAPGTVAETAGPGAEIKPHLAPTISLPDRVPNPRAGFVPPLMDLSHLKADRLPDGVDPSTIPATFDWREAGIVTPVKNQGACGSCYAFSMLGNFEALLMKDGQGVTDLSENNAKECNWWEASNFEPIPGYPVGSCDEGRAIMVANLYSKKGSVLEACDPYVPSDTACKTTCPYQHTLTGWAQLNGSTIPDTNALKSFIQTYGPVATTLYVGARNAWGDEFDLYDGSYTLHYTGTQPPNHGVLVVGWDDSLPHAGGTGGWIVKNSWGTGWGGTAGYGSEGGYFTIAYGSASFGMYSAATTEWMPFDPLGNLLLNDEAGWSNSVGYFSTTASVIVKLSTLTPTWVTNIEFWTTDAQTEVDVFIYEGFDGYEPSGMVWSKHNVQLDQAGYHSVAVNPPVQMAMAQSLYARVDYSNQTFKYPIPVDDEAPWVANQSWTSTTGMNGTWDDLGVSNQTDVGVRLRTSSIPSTPTPTPVARVYLPLILYNHAHDQVPTPTATPPSGWQTILIESFEGDWGAHWDTWGNPTWGTATCLSSHGARSVWSAAAGSAARVPCVDNYPNNMDSRLFYGPFDLSGASDAMVTFYHYQKTKPNDYLWWMASKDGVNFWGSGFSGDSGGWTSQVFDLTNVYTLGDLTGEPQVWLVFQATSDGAGTDKGILLDRVSIQRYFDAASAAAPAAAAAGTPVPRDPDLVPGSLVLERAEP